MWQGQARSSRGPNRSRCHCRRKGRAARPDSNGRWKGSCLVSRIGCCLAELVHGILKGDVTIAAPVEWKIIRLIRVSARDVASSLCRAVCLLSVVNRQPFRKRSCQPSSLKIGLSTRRRANTEPRRAARPILVPWSLLYSISMSSPIIASYPPISPNTTYCTLRAGSLECSLCTNKSPPSIPFCARPMPFLVQVSAIASPSPSPSAKGCCC
jgi:hypothetical protein